MKSVNAFLWATLSIYNLSAQNQSIDSLSVITNFLDEVVVSDSRFAFGLWSLADLSFLCP